MCIYLMLYIPNGITFKESETLSPGGKLTIFPTQYDKLWVGTLYDTEFPELTTFKRTK